MIMTRALLIGLCINESLEDTQNSLLELEELASVLGISTIDKVIQKSDTISNSFFIGSGKALEIKKVIEVLEIEMAIFDTTLSPAQLRNLEETLDVEIMDRSFLILQIFASNARSRESVLEVSLAQKTYMLPRLIGINKSLSRQGGSSFNSRGPGETKLELDRRKLSVEIERIKRELKQLSIQKENNKKRRISDGIKIVSLVGYTNAGKSSTMNSLINVLSSNNEEVLEKNQVFATLDTKVKRLRKENEPPFLLIDTVGFIDKLPHELINSFKSTLKDSLDADLLLLVVDSTGDINKQVGVTNDILKEIGALDIERLYVFTKMDLLLNNPNLNEEYIFISNKTLEGIDNLVNQIYTHLYKDSMVYEIKVSHDRGDIINYLRGNTHIVSTRYEDDQTVLRLVLSDEVYQTLSKKLGGNNEKS